MTHQHDVRIYYEDTDAGGIVYYANYLKFCERARTELLRSAGFTNTSLKEDHGALLVVRRIEAEYLAPARLDDLLQVRTVVEEVNHASFAMKQSIFRDNELYFELSVLLVCVNDSGRPDRLPEEIRSVLEAHKS